MARVAIDIDSTLHHFWDQFAEVVRRLHAVELPYERQLTWAIPELAPEQLAESVAASHADDLILEAEPYPGAVEAIREWHETGHFIHITSHRSTAAHAATEQWLRSIGLPFDDLYCSYDKVTRCVEIGIDVLIDDSPINLVRAADQGIAAATLIHPWNRELCSRPDVICAEDWPTLAEQLRPLLR